MSIYDTNISDIVALYAKYMYRLETIQSIEHKIINNENPPMFLEKCQFDDAPQTFQHRFSQESSGVKYVI